MKGASFEFESGSLDADRDHARGNVRRIEVVMRQRRLQILDRRRAMHEHRRTDRRRPDWSSRKAGVIFDIAGDVDKALRLARVVHYLLQRQERGLGAVRTPDGRQPWASP